MPISIITILRIVLRRTNGNRRLVAAMLIGVVLAVALMSSTAIYRDALDELGLQFDLENAEKSDIDLLITTSNHLMAETEYTRDQELIDRRLNGISQFLDGRARTGTSATFFLTELGVPVSEESSRPRARFQFLTNLDPQINIDEGRFPEAANGSAEDQPRIEVALGTESAQAFGVGVGDVFELHPFWRQDRAPIPVLIVGLISPIEPEGEYWRQRRDHFVIDTPNWQTFGFFVPEDTFFDALAVYLPDITADLETLGFVNLGSLNARNAEVAAPRIRSATQNLSAQVERTRVETVLPDVLDAFNQKQFFSRLPLLVLTLQVVGIVLYYVVMVSTLVVDRQSGEIALLKSRGAGLVQIVSVYFIEGGLMAGIALAAGPFIALGVIALLGKTPPFEGLSGGSFLSVRLTGEAYIWGAIGAGLSVLALVWPAFRASRYSIVRYKQAISRPPERTIIQRYYLDVVLVLIAAILFFQLQESDSLVTEDLFGGLEQDPLLLVAPAVFIVAVAIIFLRVFPIILTVVAWITDRFAGIAIQLGLWHLIRAPLQNARLVLLLVLATSIGMFSATFGSTLDQSFDDRADYLAGAPLRLSELRLSGASGVDSFRETWEAHPGVEQIAPVIRTNATYVQEISLTFRSDLIAVDAERLQDIAFFRDDFATQPIAELLAPLAANDIVPPSLSVPDGARRLGLWVKVPEGTQGMVISARIRDSQGKYEDISFFGLDPRKRATGEWLHLIAPLEPGAWTSFPTGLRLDFADGPLDVVSIFVRTFGFSLFTGEVFWDNLQYSTSGGIETEEIEGGFEDGVVIEPFEDVNRWEVLRGQVLGRVPDEFSLSTETAHDGSASARYAWTQRLGGSGLRGVRLIADSEPLLVVASQNYLDDAGLFIGDEIDLSLSGGFIPARIASAFDLLPTYDPRVDDGLLIVNINRFAYFANRNPGSGSSRSPNEAWIVPREDGGLSLLRADLAQEAFGRAIVFDSKAMRQAQNEDPLVAAGWEGVLFLSFLAVLILSALGFLVASFLTAQTRSLEFAILRTMGFSRRQILGVVSFEQLFIIAVAMGLGTLVGLRLGVLMLEFLGITEKGEEVIPPFQLVTDWATIGVAYGILGAVFLVTIAIVVLAYARLAVAHTLRLGES